MEDKWIAYHATRLNLIQYIDAHLRSVALTNKMTGYDLMIKLKEELNQLDFESDEENDGDVEPDYDAKTAQEMADEQREIYRTLK
jgi:hypothetical protein